MAGIPTLNYMARIEMIFEKYPLCIKQPVVILKFAIVDGRHSLERIVLHLECCDDATIPTNQGTNMEEFPSHYS